MGLNRLRPLIMFPWFNLFGTIFLGFSKKKLSLHHDKTDIFKNSNPYAGYVYDRCTNYG